MPRFRDNKYPPVDRHTTPQGASRFLAELAASADTAGIDIPAISEAQEMLRRARAHRADYANAKAQRRAATTAIAEGLVDADLTPAQAAKQAGQAEAAASAVMASAAQETTRVAARRALEHVGSHTDWDHVLDRCRAIVRNNIEEIRNLRPVLKDIHTAEQAVAAGTNTATAWARYGTELLPAWDAAHDVVRAARTQHWIKPLPAVTRSPGIANSYLSWASARRFAIPEAAAEAKRNATREGRPWLPLLDPACDLASPGGPYTEDELRDIEAARDQWHQDQAVKTEQERLKWAA